MASLRVLTLNMQNGQVWNPQDPDGAPQDLDQTIAFLSEMDAQVIFLQELELPPADGTGPRAHPNLDRLREALPGYQSCFVYPATKRAHLPFGIGLAIFTRLAQSKDFHVILPPADISFPFRGQTWLPSERSILGTHITFEGKEITLLNTHLQAYFMIESSSNDHPAQRLALETLARGIKGPLILGGDFNCTDKESTIEGLEACGLKTVQKDLPTWKRMPLVLDHIFYSGHFEKRLGQVVSTVVSDHDAVLAELALV